MINFNEAGRTYGETDYANPDDAWDHFIGSTPEAYEVYRRLAHDDQQEAKETFGDGWLETHEDISLEEFDATIDRIEAIQSSILYQALEAARTGAIRAYRAKCDKAFGEDSAGRFDYIGTPEHLVLVRELEAAEAQIKTWQKSITLNKE